MRKLLTLTSTLLAVTAPSVAQSNELAGVRAAADKVVKRARADGAGLTVFRGSRELHRSVHGDFASDEQVAIASASRWLAVATILTLVDDGTIKLHHPVSRYVDEFQRDDRRRMTLRQCLACTTGLPADMDDRMRGWDMDKFAEEVARKGLRSQPGSAFRESDLGFQVAALAAVRASGMGWHDLFRSRIGDRLGMRDTHFGGLHPIASEPGEAALPWVASGAVSTLSDYTRFVRMLLADGRWHGEQVMSKKSIDDMLRDQVQPLVDVRSPYPRVDDARYGFGTWIERDGDEIVRFTAPGALGFTPWIAPDRSYGGVFAVESKGAVVDRQLRFVRRAVAAAAVSPAVVGTSETVAMRHGGRERRYHLHVPPHDNFQQGLPLLVVLHGGESDGASAREVTRLDRLGIDHGFVVAFPDGTGKVAGAGLTWNAGDVGTYAARRDIDDVGFCKAVVADIRDRVVIDTDRVFVTGHSNGAMMCHRLAREAADVFKGIAPVAGAMNCDDVPSNTPLAVMMIHGTRDEHVRLAGGEGLTSRGRRPRVDAPMTAAQEYYVARNGLVDYAQEAERDGVHVTKYSTKRGDGDASPVWVVTLQGGRHAWPGARVRPPELRDRPYPWPASQAILEFFYSVGTGALQDRLTPSTPR